MEGLEYILSLPNTIKFNFLAFPIGQALHLPIWVNRKIKISEIHRGCIEINSQFRTRMVKIGFGGTDGVLGNGNRGFIQIDRNSKLTFKGKAFWGRNATIRINNGGHLILGNNFSMNCNSFISIHHKCDIGDDFLGGWNINIQDSDNHSIIHDGEIANIGGDIHLGNHVWVCSFVDILKNTFLGNDSVVAYKSLVNKAFSDNKILVGGASQSVKKKYKLECKRP